MRIGGDNMGMSVQMPSEHECKYHAVSRWTLSPAEIESNVGHLYFISNASLNPRAM